MRSVSRTEGPRCDGLAVVWFLLVVMVTGLAFGYVYHSDKPDHARLIYLESQMMVDDAAG